MAPIGPPQLLKERGENGLGPAVVFGAPNTLLIAWAYKNDLYVQRRIGPSWQPKVKLDSSFTGRLGGLAAPALAFFNGRYYVAVTSQETYWLSLMSSAGGVEWAFVQQYSKEFYGGPALAVFQNRLYLSWCSDDDRINVLNSTDGSVWRGKVTLAERSQSAPALASNGQQLLIAWRGVGNDTLNVIRGDGRVFDGKVVLGDTTPARPALVSRRAELILAWQGVGNNQLNTLVSTDGGATWGGRFTSRQTSMDGPALAANGSANEIAWTGRDEKRYLRMAIIGE